MTTTPCVFWRRACLVLPQPAQTSARVSKRASYRMGVSLGPVETHLTLITEIDQLVRCIDARLCLDIDNVRMRVDDPRRVIGPAAEAESVNREHAHMAQRFDLPWAQRGILALALLQPFQILL